MPSYTRVHHFSPTVRDIETSAEWYERVFGLQRLPMTFPHHLKEDTGHAVLLLDPATGFAIGLHTNTANDKTPFDEARTGLDHISFEVDNHDALGEWTAHLDELGIEHSGVRDITGDIPFSTVVFRDPDNIQLELIFMG